jgi:hypothetical protein
MDLSHAACAAAKQCPVAVFPVPRSENGGRIGEIRGNHLGQRARWFLYLGNHRIKSAGVESLKHPVCGSGFPKLTATSSDGAKGLESVYTSASRGCIITFMSYNDSYIFPCIRLCFV